MAFNISQQIDVRSKCANIDYLYGPYNSIQDACDAIIPTRRTLGRTIGIITGGSIVEYWWKSGISDNDLVQKMEQLTLSLSLYGDSEFTKNEGEPIYGQFVVDGGAGVKKAMLYQVVDDNEVFVQEYNNVGKRSPYTFTIPNPAVSGIYDYRIKVLDSLDNYASTASGINYVQYRLYYGGISTVYNLTELNAITVKNFASVAGVPFQLNIAVRDETFRISNVYLSTQTDENPGEYIEPLVPSSGSFIGNNTYYMPSAAILREYFNGKRCSVVVSYVEGEIVRQSVKDLFKLLDIGTLDIVPEYEGGDYYKDIPGNYIFQLQAGVENLSIVLTPGEDTDFNFERSTVLAYRRFSLKVIPLVVKENAQIVIDYHYSYGGDDYSGSFTRTIGNILNPPPQDFYQPDDGFTTTRVDLVYARESDYDGIDSETGQYYKVVNEPIVSDEILSSSFILDTYCKINQQNDTTVEFIKITYGGVDVATVTEDEISCARQWSGLYTDTPLNEWAQIGIGINLQERKPHVENETCVYHGIYINGMLVKTVLVDNSSVSPLKYDANKRLVVTIGGGILVQKSFLYYRNDGLSIISPNTRTQESIIYNNYKSHKFNFAEPDDSLPLLRFLRISNHSEIKRLFGFINDYKDDDIKHITTFGVIGAEKARTMDVYDPNYSSSTIESDATLFRQSVDIKKPAQKEYAVLCQVMWMGNVMQDVVVEVHTQGTSTLVYSVPNFKFTFWRVLANGVVPYYPQFIEIEGSNNYYHEYIYTAKADFMDSSHLNNTPTCTYYNRMIQNLRSGGVINGSPAARNNYLDAILGFPIVLEISDTGDDFGDIFTNIGSFMLNIDKTGESLGFEIDEGQDHFSCISFEGTSNDDGSGASARFDIPDGMVLEDYTHGSSTVDEAEIRSDYAVAQSALGLSLDDTIGGVLVRDLPYVKWCRFLSDGLEYRYPDSDIYKEKNDKLNNVMDVNNFIALYRMWYWVYKSDTLTNTQYKEQFITHFDLNYCIIYFINLMIFAQTDNLGKNAMFDCWPQDGEIWYPRPYDLDSEAGLDNNGNDNIAPFVEIKSVFSLNYDASHATDYEWLAANYLIDDNVVDPVTGIEYEKSTINYGSQTYDRYHFSSNSSKLWINFYKNFKTEINAFYSNLRNEYNYSPESIIGLCQDILIDKLGTAQYNKDFNNKYLSDSHQYLAYGNRWYKFKKWLTKRFAFCDSYFGASETATYNLTSRVNYSMSVDAPQYIAQQYQGEANRDTRFVINNVSFSAGSGAATKITLLANQPSIFETTLFKNATWDGGARDYKNLIRLDVSGNQNQAFSNITSVTGDSLDNLKYLNISNSAVKNLTVPPNLKTLLAENINLNSLVFSSHCAVEEISLKGSTLSGSIDFNDLPNLKRLDLTDCTFNGDVTFASLPQLENLIMTRAIFNGNITISADVNITSFDFSNLNIYSISFSGTDLQIDSINFHNTNFGYATLNIDAICQNIRNLDFSNCRGLTYVQIYDNTVFGNLEYLTLTGSSIKALGNNALIFDCVHFSNIGFLKKYVYNSNNTITETGFTFQDTKIEEISHISWTGVGTNLFRDCQKLTAVGGALNLNTNIDYMFYRCYLLDTLPAININNTVGSESKVTSAQYLFAGCNSLGYASIEAVIKSCSQVTNFTAAVRCKQFGTNETIRLNKLFANNTVVTNVNQMFSQYAGAQEFVATTNDIIINGKVPSTVLSADRMFYGLRTANVPYDILSNATSLKTAVGMFVLCTITFTGNNLPTQIDAYGASVTVRNFIWYDFLPTALEDTSHMFFGSNIVTNDTRLFRNLSVLRKTNSMFGHTSQIAITFTNSHSETETFYLDITNMWNNNPLIEDISGCFTNIYTVYCNTLIFHNDVDSSKTVNISGLLGLSSNAHRDDVQISIDIDAIVPKIKTDSYYSIPNNSSYSGPGVFQNRNVLIRTTSLNGQIFSKLNSESRNLFNGAVLYLPSTVTTFNLSNVISRCERMFLGTRLYKYSSESGHIYDVNDRKFVNVLMPTSCAYYTQMFMNSSVLSSLPSIVSPSAAYFSEMYRGCIINEPDLELPSNYFETCAASVTNTSWMFAYNMYLTTLGYSASNGLFEGCTNLSNVNSMFYHASFLHKGIPVNLFGETALPKLTSLSAMFYATSIIYDVENDSHKWFNYDTIEPLINLENIQEMFSCNKINPSVNDFPTIYGTMNQTVTNLGVNTAVIDPNTFTTKPLTNISKLFKHSVINPPATVGGFKFTGFSIGTEAFFGCSAENIDLLFVDNSYLPSIVNADRMFYQVYTSPRFHGYINNLSTFVTNITAYPNISKANIAGNIIDDDIASTYKENIPSIDNTDVFLGLSLKLSTTPESWPTDGYGRYYYTNA